MKPARNRGMVDGRFWALLRNPDGLPVLFGSRQDAEENRDFDEYLVRVKVHPMSLKDLLRGWRELARREKLAATAKRRPRIPVEQKRRRGTLKLAGAGILFSELQKMRPKVRRRFEQAIALEAQALNLGRQKGKRRAAASRVRR